MSSIRDFEHSLDFTEAEYLALLEMASASYAFASFVAPPDQPHVLWRHDVDFSVHRAHRLATLEAQRHKKATYFFMLRSPFYNLLEPEIVQKAYDILEMGHGLGLHFDAGERNGESPDARKLQQRLKFEKRIIEDLFCKPVEAFSLHNPDRRVVGNLQDRDTIEGMVNVYSRTIQASYFYCSDSNGVWRHRRLKDVLSVPPSDRLHVLTHPEWWVPTPMSPRQRVLRCLQGRADAALKSYDDLLERHGRPNVR